jgi:hypothetical protein
MEVDKLEYITRERFDNVVKNKHIINLEELINIIENEFGYSVNLEDKDKGTYNKQQIREMTKAIFNNPKVLKQLHESSLEPDDEYIEGEEEFIKLIHEDKQNDGQI